MMHRPKYITCFTLLILLYLGGGFPTALAQKVSISASVNKTTAAPGETVRYTIRVEGSSTPRISKLTPPDLENLQLLSPQPSVRRQTTIINGRQSRRLSYEWLLQVQQEKATIGSATVSIHGSSYKTKPIQITVTGSNASTDNPPSGNDKDVFIRVQPQTTEVYTNEQVVVSYKLYFKEGYQIQNSRMADSWKADGLWREELHVNQHPRASTEVINGIRYNTIMLKRVAFFPTRSGSLQIDPLRIESQILRPYRSRGRNSFDFRVPRDERLYTATIASPPVNITARSLPKSASPAFSGTVGYYTIKSSVDRTTVKAGEAVKLSVTVSGTGNIATLQEPVINLPESFEKYDPEVTKEIHRRGDKLRGKKTFSYVIIPQKAGTFSLPPVLMTFFDPEKKEYVTQNSRSRSIEVTPAPNASGSTHQEIAGLITNTELMAANSRRFLYRQRWPYAVLAFPVVLLLGLWGLQQWKHKRRQRMAARQAQPQADKHLNRAHQFRQEGNAEAFYAELERALYAFIHLHLNQPVQGLTKTQLDHRLQAVDIPAELRLELQQLLDECEQACYSPAPPQPEAMKAAAQRTRTVLNRLDTILNPSTAA